MSYPEYIIMNGVRVTIGEGGILRVGGKAVGMADLRPAHDTRADSLRGPKAPSRERLDALSYPG